MKGQSVIGIQCDAGMSKRWKPFAPTRPLTASRLGSISGKRMVPVTELAKSRYLSVKAVSVQQDGTNGALSVV